ncbi:MAG: BPSS1780 family membrane protein [Sedimenticola sp.]|nr:BPSS1780 family membrane protein [Sedimenticola sp.]
MGELYRVIYTGQLRLGIEKSAAIAGFCERFKVAEEKARKVLSASHDLVLKKDLEQGKAVKYQRALEAIGLIVRLEPMERPSGLDGISLVPVEDAPETPGAPSPLGAGRSESTQPICPKCGSDRLQSGSCMACGIVIAKYLARQAAEAEMADESSALPPAGEPGRSQGGPGASAETEVNQTTEPMEGALCDPLTHPAGQGWQWIVRGFWHFKQNPLAWMLTMVIWVVLSIVIGLIPFVCSLVITLFSPVILAGFMLGCAAQEHGADFEISHLFAGFSSSVGQLVLVGLLYVAGFALIGIIMVMLGGGVMIGFMGGMDVMESTHPGMMGTAAGIGSVILMALVVFGLSVPLMMAYWFAPALIAMEGLSALAAMKLSFAGCMKNILPFLVYSIVMCIILVVGSIPVGLGLLVVMPIITASMYTAYRDIYYY